MRKDYKSVNDVNIGLKKKYLLSVCKSIELKDKLYECMSEKSFHLFVSQYKQILYNESLKALYGSSDYDTLEYHLVMINALFKESSFQDIKNQLFKKISKKTITINEYCVIRQLIDFKNISFVSLMETLHDRYEVDNEECARICLLEDQYHLACTYLKQLDDCQDQYILDLLSSFSIYEYTSLMRCYTKKKGRYLLAPSH